jgi:hypothetical protein
LPVIHPKLASIFLTSLARRLGRHTLQHIRSLASGVSTHAVNVGVIDSNPWHDCKVLGKTIEPGETQHYTLEEAENVITALVNHVDAQTIFSLAFFVGLRPGKFRVCDGRMLTVTGFMSAVQSSGMSSATPRRSRPSHHSR